MKSTTIDYPLTTSEDIIQKHKERISKLSTWQKALVSDEVKALLEVN